MYHAIVRLKLRNAFRAINRGDYRGIVPQFLPHHRHVLHGQSALSGERTTTASTARWYDRLQRVLPGLRFDVRAIAVTGWPWRTTALVAWTDHFRLPDGTPASNEGVHEFVLAWGRVRSLVIHCDTVRLDAYCREIARQGRHEATAAPIDDIAGSDAAAAPP